MTRSSFGRTKGKSTLAACVIFVSGGTLATFAADPTVTLTSPASTFVTSPLSEESDLTIPPEEGRPAGNATDENSHTIRVHPDQIFQTMDGFGGCFNELGWTALNTLSDSERQDVLKNLFDPSAANFNFCRLPIGANDYALDWYSLDDIPGDNSLGHFSMARDEMFLIPYIRAAMACQPGLRLWASDWSPPAWLKTNNTYHGGTLKMDADSLNTYAAYLSRFVQEYRKRGLNLVSLFVQNEPLADAPYPSCPLNADQIATFVGTYLGPRFAADKPGADIWLGTLNVADFKYVDRILSDPVAGPFFAGVGFQWAGKDSIGPTHEKYPQLTLMQTESECGNGSDNWADAAHTWSLFRHYLTNGASRYIYWNMVLDETGSSTWGWHQNALITVQRADHKVRYNPEFYLMEHLSHFVQLQAKRIGTDGDWPDTLSFQNPDGSVIVLAANFTGKDADVHVHNGNKAYKVSLPNSSIATLDFPAGSAGLNP